MNFRYPIPLNLGLSEQEAQHFVLVRLNVILCSILLIAFPRHRSRCFLLHEFVQFHTSSIEVSLTFVVHSH